MNFCLLLLNLADFSFLYLLVFDVLYVCLLTMFSFGFLERFFYMLFPLSYKTLRAVGCYDLAKAGPNKKLLMT